MAIYVNTFFEKRRIDLLDLADRVQQAFASAQVDYRLVGGLAAYLYVEEAEPDAGRLTKDIDVTVRRADVERIKQAVKPFGLEHCLLKGEDMLLQSDAPSKRRAVHLIRVSELGPHCTIQGIRVASVADLVRMKLTSFRLKDQTHVKDLDEAGLITSEIEAGLLSHPA